MSSKLRVGVAGPVGSGKTALVETLCLSMKKNYEIAVVTNDIYTKEDADFLINKKVLEEGRIIGVETGGCPHTAIREDCSLNKNAVLDLENKFNPLDFVFVESGGDNLASILIWPIFSSLMINSFTEFESFKSLVLRKHSKPSE